jgi:hypothetical protein
MELDTPTTTTRTTTKSIKRTIAGVVREEESPQINPKNTGAPMIEGRDIEFVRHAQKQLYNYIVRSTEWLWLQECQVKTRATTRVATKAIVRRQPEKQTRELDSGVDGARASAYQSNNRKTTGETNNNKKAMASAALSVGSIATEQYRSSNDEPINKSRGPQHRDSPQRRNGKRSTNSCRQHCNQLLETTGETNQ